MTLSRQHRQQLKASGIARDVRQERGYDTATTSAELKKLGFSAAAAAAVPALVIPVHDVHGAVAFHQIRPDNPRMLRRRTVKYETPAKTRMVLDVPPSTRASLGDPAVPLFVTEGVKKADAAASVGMACIDLLGVFNFRGRNERDGVTALPDWESVALNGRTVYLVFDSDVMRKPQVAQALRRLCRFLESRGATALPVYLPSEKNGSKVGLDDFLAAGHTVDEVIALSTKSVVGGGQSAYQESDGAIYWNRPGPDGATTPVPLSNFTARIARQELVDDGVERQRLLVLDTRFGAVKREVELDAARFAGHNRLWVIEHLGAGAIVTPAAGSTHLTAAIQSLSGDIPEHVSFGHTGWRQLPDGQTAYLHGAGAISSTGHRDDVAVRMPEELKHYTLPAPPTPREARLLVIQSLDLLDIAPDVVSVPLWASPWRAALGTCDFAVYMTGKTGSGKSELAALAQQHFGPGMNARRLPGSYSSTVNALEKQAFVLADALFVIDDFAPAGAAHDISRQHGTLERLLRNIGNGAGRGRMNADGSMRRTYTARGLILTSGEEIPRGHSVRARALLLDVHDADVHWNQLTQLQLDSAAGDSAQLMASFLQWHARRRRSWLAARENRLVVLRGRFAAGADGHRRTPNMAAELYLGVLTFLRFAIAIDALTPLEARAVRRRCWAALRAASAAQAEHQLTADPVVRSQEILRDALAADRAALTFVQPKGRKTIGDGASVGWVEEQDAYLIPEATYGLITDACRRGGAELGMSKDTLWRRWGDAGVLRSRDTQRQRLTVRHTIHGTRRVVLHVSLDWLTA